MPLHGFVGVPEALEYIGQVSAQPDDDLLAVALEAHLLGLLQVRKLVWSVPCVRQDVEGRRLVELEDGEGEGIRPLFVPLEGQETDRRLSRESRILVSRGQFVLGRFHHWAYLGLRRRTPSNEDIEMVATHRIASNMSEIANVWVVKADHGCYACTVAEENWMPTSNREGELRPGSWIFVTETGGGYVVSLTVSFQSKH